MGRKLNAFLDGMVSIFNIIPKSTFHKANYIKPEPIKKHSGLNGDKNGITQNMQKILTKDLGNALNQDKEHLNTEDRKQVEKISRLNEEIGRYYNKANEK